MMPEAKYLTIMFLTKMNKKLDLPAPFENKLKTLTIKTNVMHMGEKGLTTA